MKWEIENAYSEGGITSESIKSLLADGWEPFSVVKEDEGGQRVWFRRNSVVAEHQLRANAVAEHLAKRVEDLGFSTRTRNCLDATGIKTVGDLVKNTPGDLMNIYNFGKLCLGEVSSKLAEFGLSLASHG